MRAFPRQNKTNRTYYLIRGFQNDRVFVFWGQYGVSYFRNNGGRGSGWKIEEMPQIADPISEEQARLYLGDEFFSHIPDNNPLTIDYYL